jgi:hypothetical protein
MSKNLEKLAEQTKNTDLGLHKDVLKASAEVQKQVAKYKQDVQLDAGRRQVKAQQTKQAVDTLTSDKLKPGEGKAIAQQFENRFVVEDQNKAAANAPASDKMLDLIAKNRTKAGIKQAVSDQKKAEKGIAQAQERQTRREVSQATTERQLPKDESRAIRDQFKQSDAYPTDNKPRKTKEQSKAEVDDTRKKAQDAGYEPVQTQDGMIRTLKRAQKEGKAVITEYIAQGGDSGQGGETGNYRFKRDTVISEPYFNKKGYAEYKVINNEGQLRTRHLNHPDSGSKTVSVTRTVDDAPYTYENGKVYDRGGNEVDQVQQQGTFSKEIEAAIEQDVDGFSNLLKQYKNQAIPIKEIMTKANGMDDATLTKTLESAPHEVNDQLHQDQTGRPCG